MTLDPGQMRLHRSADPALDAGAYRVHIQADTLSGVARQEDHFIEVTGPQLRLEPAEVSALSPPEQTAIDAADQFPYIALTRRTLPWERSGPVALDGMWLALLVTREAPSPEAALGTGSLSEAVALPGVAPATTVSLLRVNSAGVGPVRDQLKAPAARCHVREISLADTATMGPDDDGWQSVVVASRLPVASAGAGSTYRATLVSLEGRGDLPPAPGATSATLLALHSWLFTSLTGGPTFETLLRDRLTVAPFDPTATLPGVDRNGREATVAYRSPLSGGALAPPPDPDTEDVTRRAAFELGRLLAVADGRLLRELVEWRRARQRAAMSAVTDRGLAGVLDLPAPLAAVAAPGARRRSAQATAAVLGALDGALPEADVFDTRGPA